MSNPKIYIDGKEGTTGLQIDQRLGGRRDIDLLLIDEDKRKDPDERKKFLNAADLVFLCLPDAAAREAVAMIENPKTRVIDASTAHRTRPGLGVRLPRAAARPAAADQVCRPGGQPGLPRHRLPVTVAPLVELGVLPGLPPGLLVPYRLHRRGKKLIAEYEAPGRDPRLDAPAPYAWGCSTSTCPRCRRWPAWTARPPSCRCWGTSPRGWSPAAAPEPAALRRPRGPGHPGPAGGVLPGPGPGGGGPLRGGRPPGCTPASWPGSDKLRITVSGTPGADPPGRPVRQPGQGGRPARRCRT